MKQHYVQVASQNLEMEMDTMKEKITILHVDDDPLEQEFILWQLRRNAEDLEIIEAKNGQDALRKIREKEIECIVSDYQMPIMNGIELLQALRKQNNNVPFILLTGFSDNAILEKAKLAGVSHFYTKSERRNGFSHVVSSIRELVNNNRGKVE